jgi:signal transduction histidine kinase
MGQLLALTKMKLAAVAKATKGSPIATDIAAISDLVQQVIHQTRSLTFEVSPPVLYQLGLQPAIEWLAAHIQQNYGVAVRCELLDRRLNLADASRVFLFRAVRELLMNVIKHSRAKSASVVVVLHPRAVQIRVRDEGVGFDPDTATTTSASGFGLFSIRERMDYLGGGMQIISSPGEGTTVILTAPLEKNVVTEGDPPLRGGAKHQIPRDPMI